MERRRVLQALAALAALLMVFALAQGVRAEPETDEHGRPVVAAPSTDPTEATTEEATTTTTEPPSTMEWEGLTDEEGVTLYPPRPSAEPQTTKKKPTTTKATTTKPTTTTYVPLGYIPNFYETVPTKPGETTATTAATSTTTQPTTTQEAVHSSGGADLFEEYQPQPVRWGIVVPAGVLLLAALCGVIAMLRRGGREAEEAKAFEGGLWGPPPEEEEAYPPIEFPGEEGEAPAPGEAPEEAPEAPAPEEPAKKKSEGPGPDQEITKDDIQSSEE